MFGLPAETFAIMTLIPAAWIGYTVAFWVLSRDWHLADEEL